MSTRYQSASAATLGLKRQGAAVSDANNSIEISEFSKAHRQLDKARIESTVGEKLKQYASDPVPTALTISLPARPIDFFNLALIEARKANDTSIDVDLRTLDDDQIDLIIGVLATISCFARQLPGIIVMSNPQLGSDKFLNSDVRDQFKITLKQLREKNPIKPNKYTAEEIDAFFAINRSKFNDDYVSIIAYLHLTVKGVGTDMAKIKSRVNEFGSIMGMNPSKVHSISGEIKKNYQEITLLASIPEIRGAAAGTLLHLTKMKNERIAVMAGKALDQAVDSSMPMYRLIEPYIPLSKIKQFLDPSRNTQGDPNFSVLNAITKNYASELSCLYQLYSIVGTLTNTNLTKEEKDNVVNYMSIVTPTMTSHLTSHKNFPNICGIVTHAAAALDRLGTMSGFAFVNSIKLQAIRERKAVIACMMYNEPSITSEQAEEMIKHYEGGSKGLADKHIKIIQARRDEADADGVNAGIGARDVV